MESLPNAIFNAMICILHATNVFNFGLSFNLLKIFLQLLNSCQSTFIEPDQLLWLPLVSCIKSIFSANIITYESITIVLVLSLKILQKLYLKKIQTPVALF